MCNLITLFTDKTNYTKTKKKLKIPRGNQKERKTPTMITREATKGQIIIIYKNYTEIYKKKV